MNRKAADNRIREKRRSRLLLLVLLLLIVAVLLTELVLLRRLGSLENRAPGRLIDTIVLSPEQKPRAVLALCGRVRMADGTAASGIGAELHSAVRMTVTDEAGDFYFADVEEGAHVLTLRDAAGNELMHQALDLACGKNGTLVFTVERGAWRFEVPDGTLVLELDLTMDAAAGTLSANVKSMTAIGNGGTLSDSSGRTFTARDGAILTPHGSLLLTDGTIALHQGGALLPDGVFVSERGEVFETSGQTSAAALPEGYTLRENNAILTTPDGTDIYLAECRAVLADGAVVSENSVTLPDGTVIDHGKAEIMMPDGQVIRGEAGEASAVVLSDGREVVMPEKDTGYRLGGEKLQPLSYPEDGDAAHDAPEAAGQPDEAPQGEADRPEQTDAPDAETQPGQTEPQGDTPGGSPDAGDPADDQKDEQKHSFSVTDTASGTKWTQLTTIDLFYQCEKLYPGVSGSYEFSVLNGILGAAFFRMTIAEAAHESGALPLEYRLRDADGYVTGEEWLNAEQLGETEVTLEIRGSILYTLEWRWPYERGSSAEEIAANDRQDAALGSSDELTHEITVTIRAEAVG